MISWRKLGHIFSPSTQFEWMNSHAYMPIALHIKASVYKIYFSSRNAQNKSNIGWITIDLNDVTQIINITSTPLLALGNSGFFDSDGITVSDIVKINSKIHLYYVGWNLGKNVPFRNAIGLAIQDQQDTLFVKHSEGPILDRSIYDPCFVASHCVIEKDGQYLMYYLSCLKWEMKNGQNQHQYHLKIAISEDGIKWQPTGIVAIDFEHENEYAISVPRVHYINSKYRMWYSYRGNGDIETYRIGYAESEDAINWTRKDNQVGIDVSDSGWDSDMICYPYVFENGNNLYMLYNGNGYGKSGFGLAVLEGNL